MSVVVRIIREVAYQSFVQDLQAYIQAHPGMSPKDAANALAAQQGIVLDDGELDEVLSRLNGAPNP